jgi:hypothetical protein
MPIVQINLNVALAEQEKQALLLSVAGMVSDVMAKPFADVMVSLTITDFVMAGNFEPAAFVELRCLSGLDVAGTTKLLCEGLLANLQQHVAINPARVYINFVEACPEYAWRFCDGVAVCPQNADNAR